MPKIDAQHPLYKLRAPQWQRCRDTYDGEDAVKSAGVTYLPRVGGMDFDEYAGYKNRASFFNAVARTVDGFVGAIARKPSIISLPGALSVLETDADGGGTPIEQVLKELCAEALLTGRLGVLVDVDDAGIPKLLVYPAESIINWAPGMFVLTETVYASLDGFDQKMQTQYRVLRLDNGQYSTEVWKNNADAAIDSDNQFSLIETRTPTVRGEPLPYIPFALISTRGNAEKLMKPPLLGLVDISLSHYRTSADLEHGRHFSALPTLFIAGARANPDDPIRVGSTAAIEFEDSAGKAAYAEFSGQGLQSLETALKDKELHMSVLGAQTFTAGAKGVESATTAEIRRSGETSLLMSTVVAVENLLRQSLVFASEWAGAPADITVRLNRDFVDTAMDPMEIQQLVSAYQAGVITLETLLYNLEQADKLPPDVTAEQEAKSLAAAAAPR